jgi:predicted extracellular nuclease
MHSPFSPATAQQHALPGLRTTLATALFAAFAANAMAASDVVISQVYGGGGNAGTVYKNDFIELFNRSANPVNVNGWSVQYASATGTSFQVTALPNVTLQPGQYLLVQEAAGTGGTTNLPTADKVGTIALSGTTGKVVLANTITAVTSATAPAVQDLVSWGPTATPFEGSAAAPATTNTTAAVRADSGCTDTDQNAADFSTVAPTPRNSASALHACAAPAAAIVPTCPATLTLAPATGGSAAFSALDVDGIVNAITLAANTPAGISLSGVTPASGIGGVANASLSIAASLAAGSYPVTINFANNQSQSASCVVTVTVQAPATLTHNIMQIQGNGATSPLVGNRETTEGVVTLKVATGFYMQDEVGDGDPTTSDGIYVYTGTAPTVAVGDLVRVTGTVTEFAAGDAARPITELTSVAGVTVRSSGHSITPVNLTLPLASTSEWEQYEGMLVHFTRPLIVSQNYFLGRYGQLSLSGSRLEIPTNRYPARSAEALALDAVNKANVIILDDASTLQNPNPIPYIGLDNTVRAGDSVSNLTGVIDFGLTTASNPGPSGYKLQPVATPTFSRDNARTAAPEVVGGNVKIASFNVLNFFSTFQNGSNAAGQTGQGCSLGTSVSASNCRGANNLAEFVRQRAKIASAMKSIDADVFGLMEMQNNGDVAITQLVNELNSQIGSTSYAFVPVDPTITGDDAIRVAMIYKPAKLSLVGAAMTDTDAINNRPPLAQVFALPNGKKFSLVVNHLKSKSSCPGDGSLDDDQGDNQGCWNARRQLQAQRLVTSFIPRVQAAANDSDVIAIGDFNAYGAEDPILTMEQAGMVREIEKWVRPHSQPYSFVFDSVSGYLDHALTTASASAKVTGVAEWHVNADEPSVIDYNTEFKVQDLYSASPYRASDHDPVVIGLNLQPAVVDITAQIKAVSSGLLFNRATGLYTGTITITNTGSTALNGPFKVQLDNLTTGVTLTNASGTHNGSSYLNATAANLAVGGTMTVSVSFANPAKVGISYSTRVFSGNF